MQIGYSTLKLVFFTIGIGPETPCILKIWKFDKLNIHFTTSTYLILSFIEIALYKRKS